MERSWAAIESRAVVCGSRAPGSKLGQLINRGKVTRPDVFNAATVSGWETDLVPQVQMPPRAAFSHQPPLSGLDMAALGLWPPGRVGRARLPQDGCTEACSYGGPAQAQLSLLFGARAGSGRMIHSGGYFCLSLDPSVTECLGGPSSPASGAYVPALC